MRKRDDPHEGYLYRVVERVDGGDWVHTSYGHYGKPRTYMTLAAARGTMTRMRNTAERYSDSDPGREFAVQRMPVEGWELVDG